MKILKREYLSPITGIKNTYLTKLYKSYNKKYFNGKLKDKIYFKKMPHILLKLLTMYDLFLTITPITIYSKKRKYNIYFKDIMKKVVEEYASILESQCQGNK